jgi:CheY-like chemotaxis protein
MGGQMTERILYVDDDPVTGWTRLKPTGLKPLVREKQPAEVADDKAVSQALVGIKLVLMDYRLHEDVSESAAPIDGLELIERFRATIRRHGQERKPVPLLAIYTALRNELAEQLEHCPSVPYMLARRANVDWVFEKGHLGGSDDPFGLQLRNILNAFDLDVSNCGDDPQAQLEELLQLPRDEP